MCGDRAAAAYWDPPLQPPQPGMSANIGAAEQHSPLLCNNTKRGTLGRLCAKDREKKKRAGGYDARNCN
jgi:hypothetical protein